MEDPKAALNSGIIVQEEGLSKQRLLKFFCKLCQVSFTDNIQIHINNKTHVKLVTWEAISIASPSQYLLSTLPDNVRRAKQNGEVQAIDKNRFSYLCKVCSGKEPFSGLRQLQDHLSGESHKKSKNLTQTISPTQRSSLSQSLSAQKVPETNSSCSTLPGDVQILLANKTIRIKENNGLKSSFLCLVCSNLSMTGVEPLLQHVRSSKHTQNESQRILVSDSSGSSLPPEVQALLRNRTINIKESNGLKSSFICLVCNNLSMTGVDPLMQHVRSSKHERKATQQSNVVPVPTTTSSVLPAEVQILVQDKKIKITESNGIKSYICVVCNNVQMNGVEPLMQHIQGSKHKNNEQRPYLVLDSRDLTPSAKAMKLHPQEPFPDIPTEKLKNEVLHNKKRNIQVVVLNYIEFLSNLSPHLSNRQGAHKDSTNLNETFTNIGYDVSIHESLTESDTEIVLNNLQTNTSMECLILIILSHGHSRNCFYTRDGGVMNLDKIRKKFTDRTCPQLRGLPKIILSNFCRGQDMELQTDAVAYVEVPHNMVTIHACVDEIQALRHPRNGTVFISSFCKVLENDLDLQDMLDKLYEKMKEENGTTPMQETFPPFPKFTF